MILGLLAGLALALAVLVVRAIAESQPTLSPRWLASLRLAPRVGRAPDAGPYRTRFVMDDARPSRVAALKGRMAHVGKSSLEAARRWVFAAAIVAGGAIAIALFGLA
jgi:hypothetical protein